MTGPDAGALGWAADVIGCRDLAVVRGLREGGSPWLLRADGRELVLRIGAPSDAAPFATEVAALRRPRRASRFRGCWAMTTAPQQVSRWC